MTKKWRSIDDINYKLFILPLQAKGKHIVGNVGWVTLREYGIPFMKEEFNYYLKITGGWA